MFEGGPKKEPEDELTRLRYAVERARQDNANARPRQRSLSHRLRRRWQRWRRYRRRRV